MRQQAHHRRVTLHCSRVNIASARLVHVTGCARA